MWLIIWYGWIEGMILLIDCTAKPAELGGREVYRRIDRFTDQSRSEIIAKGYKSGKGWHDNLLWAFVPVFVKLNGFKLYTVLKSSVSNRFKILFPEGNFNTAWADSCFLELKVKEEGHHTWLTHAP